MGFPIPKFKSKSDTLNATSSSVRNVVEVINFDELKRLRLVPYICEDISGMKKAFFKFLAKLNKAVLPSYSKKQLDLSRASKFQMALIGWRYFVTTRALG